MNLISGKEIANKIKQEIKNEVLELAKRNIIPHLAIIQVGDNPASNVYIRNKIKLSEELNSKTTLVKLDANVSQDELINKIHELNNNDSINGILLQLPISKHINEEQVLNEISPIKDVDCFTMKNTGKLWTAKKHQVQLKSCTPAGVIDLLKYSNIDIVGKHVVIVGRSNIVGKPLAALFLLEDATVTISHSKTKDLKSITRLGDIVVMAIGSPKFLKKDFIKDGAIVIDVGINRNSDNKICGDTDFDDIKDKCSYITPVPGGVGPMTVMMLMKNLINLTKIQKGIK